MNGLLSFLQQASLSRRPAAENAFLQNLGVEDLVDQEPGIVGHGPGPAPSPIAAAAAPPTPRPGPPAATATRVALAPDAGLGEPTPAGPGPGTAPMTERPQGGQSGVRQVVGSQGSRAIPQGEWRIPSADKLADLWQEIHWMTAADPQVAKQFAPQLEAIQGLALDRHVRDFKGDPMADPVGYARHLGRLSGRFGEPMSAKDAATWGQYLEGQQAKRLERAKAALNAGNLGQLNHDLDALMPGWKATAVTQGSYNLAGLDLPSHVYTLQGPKGERQELNSVEFELAQASLESKIKVAEAQQRAAEKQAAEPTRRLQAETENIKAQIANTDAKAQLAQPPSPLRQIQGENELLRATQENQALKSGARPGPAGAGTATAPSKEDEEDLKLVRKLVEQDVDPGAAMARVNAMRAARGVPPLGNNPGQALLQKLMNEDPTAEGAGATATAGSALPPGDQGPPEPPEIAQREAQRLQALPRSERQQVLMERQQANEVRTQQQAALAQRNRERLTILEQTREQVKANAQQRAAALAELDALQGLTPEQERQAAWLTRYLLDPKARENTSMEPKTGRAVMLTPQMPDTRM